MERPAPDRVFVDHPPAGWSAGRSRHRGRSRPFYDDQLPCAGGPIGPRERGQRPLPSPGSCVWACANTSW